MFQRPSTLNHVDVLLTEHLLVEGSQWTEYKLLSLSEEQKTNFADRIVTRLFNDIKSKALSVDFSILDDTKGDITKLKNYKAISNALSYLNKVANQSDAGKKVPELKDAVNELSLTFSILQKYSPQFKSGYVMNNSIIRYLYTSLSIALIQSTSFLVAESVVFVKDNLNLYKTEVKHSKNISRNNYIKALKNFNTMEKKGQLVKFFKDNQQFNEAVNLGAIAGKAKGLLNSTGLPIFGQVVAVIGLIGFVLMTIRAIIFTYFDTRVRLSQYLKHLKDFVEMNASTLGTDARTIKERQEKIAVSLGKLSDVISVDQNVANDRANSQLEQSNKILAIGGDTNSTSTDLDLY